TSGTRHSDRSARARDRRLLRRADLRPSVPPRALARLRDRDDSRRTFEDVRRRDRRRIPRHRAASAKRAGQRSFLQTADASFVALAARGSGMNRRRSDHPTFLTLRGVARVYVTAVIAAGAASLVAAALQVKLEHAGLFAILLGLAVATSAAKIDLPLGRSHSNLSLSHA